MIENPKLVGILAIALTFAFGGAVAQAQQPTKIPRIGWLAARSYSTILIPTIGNPKPVLS
jgi:hypothetical protein